MSRYLSDDILGSVLKRSYQRLIDTEENDMALEDSVK